MTDIDELFGAFDEEPASTTQTANGRAARKRSRSEEDGAARQAAAQPRPAVRVTDPVKEDERGRNVTSFAAYPADYAAPPPRPPRPAARTWPFELDGFQRRAIACIDKTESVLVSAHTSAGKTVCAEYAIATALRDGQRVVYTSPIKALSNQKFRDLQEIFSDVGLMTGDITINPQASCLVMTTEILRSMLYRGSELVREVKWVVYDEIHYMRDRERGVVWEESIILLPHTVRFVFLSATIPNAREFAAWICQTHRQACHVVYTDYRPTPLVHYVFASGGEGLHLVVDEAGAFREANFETAMACLGGGATAPDADDAGKRRRRPGGRQAETDLKRIVGVVRQQQWQPAIVFAFSKAQCERNAVALKDEPSFNAPDEADVVEKVYASALEALSDDDKALPQVTTLLPLLKRGIGIHHGGLLPIVKEVVEILFQEGLLKLLFATETFAIGINMPARTVVFTETRKFDGAPPAREPCAPGAFASPVFESRATAADFGRVEARIRRQLVSDRRSTRRAGADFRWLTAGEYIQMSGRAGRRGKDDKGIVLQVLDEKMEPAVAKGILYGEADRLDSSYHVTYNMLLNLLRVEGADPDYLVRSSFHQYQQEVDAPALVVEAAVLEAQAEALSEGGDAADEAATKAHVAARRRLAAAETDVLALSRKPAHCLPWLQPGRLATVVAPADWAPTGGAAMALGLGVVVAARKPREGEAFASVDAGVACCALAPGDADPRPTHVVDVLVADEDDGAKLACVPLVALAALSAVRVFMPPDLRRPEARTRVRRAVDEVARRFAERREAVPELDDARDLGLDGKEAAYGEASRRVAGLRAELAATPAGATADADAFEAREALAERARALRRRARDAQSLVLRDELRKMRKVLRALGHVTREGVIALKGRAACELNTADELVVSELLMEGVFQDLDAAVAVALLSCLCHTEKAKEGALPPPLRGALQGAYEQLRSAATTVARACVAAGLPVDEVEYVDRFNPNLMEVLFQWANGAKFVDLTKLTDAFEGTIIRVIRRLDELLRQLASAAFAVGNFELKAKFDDASAKIKRDIVFAASLYL